VIPVSFNGEIKGDPFGGEFPGRPDHESWGELEAGVQRQVTELAQRRFEPAVRHELLRLLERRRREPTRYAAHNLAGDILQFDFLPVNVGFDTLLVRGELLINAQDYDGRPAPGARRGLNQYAKPYLDGLRMEASEVDCRELHGRVVRLTNPDMSPRELADIARNLRIRGFTASLSNITPSAPVMKAIGAPLPTGPVGPYHRDPGPGRPARVAIVDGGIAAERRADGWLDDIPRENGNIDPLDAFPLPGGDGYLDFDAGHGTFVAGIVKQIAPDAEVEAYLAVDSDCIAGEVRVACEMIRAARRGADIINLSLGCQTLDNIPPIAIRAALEIIREIEREEHRDIVIVAAAGNYADTTPCWPGAFRRVVSVAALTSDLRPAAFSSRGFWVTCSAIGQGVRSTYVAGRESVLVDPTPHDFGPDAWAAWSGTSFTAPQIVGALAWLHEKLELPMRAALETLLDAGQPIPDFGRALRILPGI
jgi:hypothetical protein